MLEIQGKFEKGELMKGTRLRRLSHTNRCGAALIIMVLLIVVFCTIIWLDPMALMKGSDSNMPWNEKDRLVRPDEEVQQPKQQQPEILNNLLFEAEAVQNDEARGGISLFILTDGRIKGGWGGAYEPRPKVTWEVVGARFKGNIDPSKIYSNEDGEDPTKLYFIAKGKFLILETNSETGTVRNVKGRIYVTGWLDHSWHGEGEKTGFVPDFDKTPFNPFF